MCSLVCALILPPLKPPTHTLPTPSPSNKVVLVAILLPTHIPTKSTIPLAEYPIITLTSIVKPSGRATIWTLP